MDLTDQAGYALASWARFDGAIDDELARAVTCGFVLVASADGDVGQQEMDEFRRSLSGFSDHLPGLDLAHVQRLFKDLGAAMLTDPVAGRARALEAVAAVKGSAESAELVRSAAEIAMAADQRVLKTESAALQAICESLDIDPR